jgi:hypothetical protein
LYRWQKMERQAHLLSAHDAQLEADDTLVASFADASIEQRKAPSLDLTLGDWMGTWLGDWGAPAWRDTSSDAHDMEAGQAGIPPLKIVEEWPRLESNEAPQHRVQMQDDVSCMVSAWLGNTAASAVFQPGVPDAAPTSSWRPQRPVLPRAKPRHVHLKAQRRAGSIGGIGMDDEPMLGGSKLRGAHRRAIGKSGRREAHERARRLVTPVSARLAAVADESEAAGRGPELATRALARMVLAAGNNLGSEPW